MHQLLENVKVLDLTHYVAGPYCTKLLADYGADVIKVERPGIGDGARRIGPFLKDLPHLEKSGLFLHLNGNKRSVTLDMKSRRGRRLLEALAQWADVLVESFRPGVMARLGLSYEALSNLNPSLVMVSLSNFGQTGPYKNYSLDEITGYGMGGMMHANGLPDREPLKLGGRVGLYQAGTVAAGATVTSLYGARAAGIGDHLDISIFETQAGSIDRRANWVLAYQYTGENALRLGPNIYSGLRPAGDGYIDMWTVGKMLPRLAQALGPGPDPALDDPADLSDAVQDLETRILDWSLSHTKQELWFKAQEQRIPSGPLNYIDEVVADPQFRATGFWNKVERPHTGSVRATRQPLRPPHRPRDNSAAPPPPWDSTIRKSSAASSASPSPSSRVWPKWESSKECRT